MNVQTPLRNLKLRIMPPGSPMVSRLRRLCHCPCHAEHHGAAGPAEKTVFISGIGCRKVSVLRRPTAFIQSMAGQPHYPAGTKLANRGGHWVISGDGDALSIGGNHLMRPAPQRRFAYILFNNEIYGLKRSIFANLKVGRSPSTHGSR